MIDLLSRLRRGAAINRLDHALLEEIGRSWGRRGLPADGRTISVDKADLASPATFEPSVRRTQEVLARFDDHQRAAIALHSYGGLPVEQLAAALELSSALVYVQIVDSRTKLIEALDSDEQGGLFPALNAVALNAPRVALWPLIESRIVARFEAEQTRQRRLSIGVAGAVCGLLALGIALVAWRDSDPAPQATPTASMALAATPTLGTAISVLPTATPTPAANVGDTILFSNRSDQLRQSWLFEERLEALPLLGENTVEAGVPVVAPDGRQVFLIWYEYGENGGATGYLGAFDGELQRELWRVEVAEDQEVEPGQAVAFRMSLAVDHERVFVARHFWRQQEPVAIEVHRREDGTFVEMIESNLAGFAAHDVRLHAPPGADRVSLFAITSEAPPETAGLQITFLSYAVPGGEKIHGRILFDLPDSRTFFLYESKLISGSEMLFGVEHTVYYNQLAVHFFDLGPGRLDPRLALPFQPITMPLPYQQAVSHNGHWLYVLSSASLEVAVVNLFDQSLAGIVPLDPGVLAGREIGVSYPQGRSMQISPDGRRIYAEGTLDGAASGVWVIDTDSWTIIDHWLPELRPAEILLSGDGQTLYARVASISGRPSSAGSLVAIDTASGAYQPLDVPDAERFSLESVATLFQRTYASSPAINGHRLESPNSTEPLAAARVDISTSGAVAGSTVTVDVSFVHPLTGEAVDPQGGGARYEAPSGVRASWSLDGETALIVDLGRIEYGHYQGFVQLDEAGKWTLRVDVDWPDGGPRDRSLLLEEAVKLDAPVTAEGSPPGDQPSG